MELSRRTFTALAGTAALGLALAGSGGAATGTHGPRSVPTGPPPSPPRADGRRHRVGFDGYSLLVDGRRLVLWSAEMHPHRLPSPSLWRDVLQKLRAHGHNAVSVPVPWNHHSPAPGTYDFTGVRDLNLFLNTAAEERLYVVLRPGPYLGADVDAGGLPGWLTAVDGTARTDDPEYLRHVDEWLSAVNSIAVRHLFTAGGGTLLLYRLEDGHGTPAGDPARRAYTAHLYARARADRIDVPLFHGDGRFGHRESGSPSPGFRSDAGHERRGHLTDLAHGITAHSVRTVFGGSPWGWLSGAGVTAPHDREAPIDEGRRPTADMAPLQQFGHLVRTVPDLARLDPAGEVRAADDRLTVYHLANPDTGAQVYVVRNDSGEPVRSMLPDTGIEVPVTVAPRDARLLVSGLGLGRRKLAYTTAQPMLSMAAGRLDVAVFVGRGGEQAQVALDCGVQPEVLRADTEPAWSYDRGRLNVVAPLGRGGLSRLLVKGGGSDVPLVLLFADDATALRLWPYETPSGSLLVYGPAMLRSATLRGSTVHLTGDVVDETGVEVWPPRGITSVTWNGQPVRTYLGRAGSLVMEGMMPDAPAVPLPELTGWRRRGGNPESEPEFDDSAWTAADRTTSHSTTPVPGDGLVLFADDYGFHYGDVWYRGRLTDTRGITSVSLTCGTGPHGLLMAWLDGHPLGTHRMPAPEEDTAGKGTFTATAVLAVPKGLRRRGRHVLSVLVRPMQHDGGARARDPHKAARGLVSVAFGGGSRDVEWRIQGAVAPDRARGPLNNGGLHGERHGWHLPEHDDRDWRAVGLPHEERRQGVAWYRTDFRLDVAPDVDASIGLTLEDEPERAYRAQIFLNGWNMGQYLNDVGSRHTFVLPNGILRTRGTNTLALAVLSDGTTPSGPRDVRLTLLGAARGGVPVEVVEPAGTADRPGR
ncbi:beta-galactosidase [Streptomyces toyocaensis]|uniref:beta-galactosidase n=1 Tax=Streptomyces toyocaensis TaxID=55952 RepID=A0A081XMG9_STRTO|nr:beta-galactosidase [Streptomyces toyocaensis]KES04742.1 beta-galactosidase [Streptomyces toyocaensis]